MGGRETIYTGDLMGTKEKINVLYNAVKERGRITYPEAAALVECSPSYALTLLQVLKEMHPELEYDRGVLRVKKDPAPL